MLVIFQTRHKKNFFFLFFFDMKMLFFFLFFTLFDSQIGIILLLQIDKMNDEIKHFPENIQKLLTDARIPIEQFIN